MRVIALTHVFPRRDGDPSAAFLATWAGALRGAGHDVRVIAPHDAGLTEIAVVEEVPVRFVRYGPEDLEVLAYRGEMHRIAATPVGPPLVVSLVATMAVALRSAVRRWQPDVVHVHWWVPGAIVARVARLGVPTVVHLHGTDVSVVEGRPALGGVARWALDAADRLEVVSTDLAERAARALGRIPDAVNPMPLAPDRLGVADAAVSPDLQVVLGVGRLLPEKGFADLIRAAARLRRPVGVRIVGDGPQEADLRRLAQDLGVLLELPGPIDPFDMPAVYAAADVVVQPSHREGLGLVAAEAAALGRPVVATDSGGVRDVLGRAGLVPVGDVERLADAIAAALDDPDAVLMAERGLRVRSLLSPAASVARTVAGWEAVTAGR